MIESVYRTGVLVVNNGYRGAKGFGKSTVSKPRVVGEVSRQNTAVSSRKSSVPKPLANTQQTQDVNLKELLGQEQHNYNKGSETYLAESELLREIKETIEKMKTSDSALLGVDKLIEHIKAPTQFGLEDIHNVERNVKNKNMKLEIGLYSLTRILEEEYKALRGQMNTAGETAEANKNTIAAGIAKLAEADNEKKQSDTQKEEGILAMIESHIAKLNKLREEKVYAERKNQRELLFYPKEGIKTQYRDVSDNDAESLNKVMQQQRHKAASVLDVYKKAIEATQKNMAVTGLGQIVLA